MQCELINPLHTNKKRTLHYESFEPLHCGKLTSVELNNNDASQE